VSEVARVLSSKASERQSEISASSFSTLGLGFSDIIKHGLVTPNEIAPPTEFAPPSSLAERVFHALADAKIWTSRVAMRLNLAARDRYFRQLDLLHDCDEWFGDDRPLLLDSYKSFVRFMLSEGGQSKPSLALNPDGHLMAVWECTGNRLTIEFKSGDRLQWVVSCADGDRTAGMTRLASIKSHLTPYRPEAWFGLG
jgi:hypothetical protein